MSTVLVKLVAEPVYVEVEADTIDKVEELAIKELHNYTPEWYAEEMELRL